MKWIDLPVDEVVKRYRAGESTPVLGRAYGVDQKTIWSRLVSAGVEMRGFGLRGDKSGNHKPGGPLHVTGGGYLGTCDREGKKCGVHRGCWEAYHGPIPSGFVVHHADEDRLNNEIQNLACMTHGEHVGLHNTERGERVGATAFDRNPYQT